MKILWFSITPALYKGKKATSGTWIESLLNIIKDNKDIGNYSAPYYMISCLAVVLQQGMRCISNFRSS